MKIKNLAFFGVMAAIMGVANAARADATTVIASQAYVDAKDDLKQNLLDSGANGNVTFTGDTTNGNVITNVSADGNGTITFTKGRIAASDYVSNTDTVDNETKDNVLEFNNASDKAPSVTAVKNMKTTSVAATGSTSDYKLPTETAVRAAITAAETTLNTTISNTSDTITGNFEDASAAGADLTELNRILGENTNATANVHNTVADTTDLQKIPRNYNIQKGIAYLKGNGIENYTRGVKNDDTPNVGIKDATVKTTASGAWEKNLNEHGDEFVPTVASVERRVQAAEANAGGTVDALDTHKTATTNHVVTGVTQADGLITGVDSAQITTSYIDSDALATSISATNSAVDTKLATEGAVRGAINALDNASEATDTNNTIHTPIVAVSQADGVVTATRGTISGAGIEANSLEYAANINNLLKDVNSGDAARCPKGSPCVLTYYVDGGKQFVRWTNMDTDNTDANVTPANGEAIGSQTGAA